MGDAFGDDASAQAERTLDVDMAPMDIYCIYSVVASCLNMSESEEFELLFLKTISNLTLGSLESRLITGWHIQCHGPAHWFSLRGAAEEFPDTFVRFTDHHRPFFGDIKLALVKHNCKHASAIIPLLAEGMT